MLCFKKDHVRSAGLAFAACCIVGLIACVSTPSGTVTPLHEAVRDGNQDDAVRLIKEGADVNAIDENMETPLHYCANNGELGLLELLLENGANPNARDKNGNTPLHFTGRNCYEASAKLLLRYGAEPQAPNNEDATPVDFANEVGCKGIAELIP